MIELFSVELLTMFKGRDFKLYSSEGSTKLHQIRLEQSLDHRCTKRETLLPIVASFRNKDGSKQKSGTEDPCQISHLTFDPPLSVKIMRRVAENAERGDRVDPTTEPVIDV